MAIDGPEGIETQPVMGESAEVESVRPALPTFTEVRQDGSAEGTAEINSFLNEAVPGGLYDWDKDKVDFHLAHDAGYHMSSIQQDGVTVAAIDYGINDKGIATIYRMRTDADATRACAKAHGRTLGDLMMSDLATKLIEGGASGVQAEVTEAGYRLIKRAAEKGLFQVVKEDPPVDGDFGQIQCRLVQEDKATTLALEATREQLKSLMGTS